jgi:hypothetical protein
MDMRFHWLRCCEAQRQFCFYWAPGKSNLGDYWTKHHCAVHHIEKRPTILTPQSTVTALRASLHRNPVQLASKEREHSKMTKQDVMKGCARHPLNA